MKKIILANLFIGMQQLKVILSSKINFHFIYYHFCFIYFNQQFSLLVNFIMRVHFRVTEIKALSALGFGGSTRNEIALIEKSIRNVSHDSLGLSFLPSLVVFLCSQSKLSLRRD